MKKIEAVILREHLEAVRGELERHGLRGGLTLVEVLYSEKNQLLFPMETRALKKSPQRIKLELIVEDAKVESVVNIPEIPSKVRITVFGAPPRAFQWSARKPPNISPTKPAPNITNRDPPMAPRFR